MAATIREVARQAEVSIATVSRALNNPHLVAEPTRSRVVDTARRLGYASRRPRTGPGRGGEGADPGRTGFVGAVVPDLANPFFPAVLRGMRSAPPAEGRHVLSLDAVEDPAVEADLVRMIARQVDSLVLLSPRLPSDRLRALTIPGRTVLFNRLIPGLPGVVVDCVDGMRRLVAHLAALGHRHVGYAGGPRTSFGDAERRRGLALCGPAGGLRVVDLGAFPPYFASGAQIADRALREGVTAVIAFNDLMALGTIVRLRERQVDVPARISVTGFDGIPLAAASTPRLTTVAPPLGRAGQTTMALLDAEVGQGAPGAPRWRVLPVRLVVGGSTAPPPGSGKSVPSAGAVR
ncbi:LacI family DNA-binding transcriptional regulator [Catenulispora subtropica]|uniref:LacI family DNA-binding transcriptional regulator n=1 Tax=Catenulispora subtropica TaxID=450798 RepID=A0ABP5EM85_9ACTN